jgi:hypothetical protein
MAPTYFGQCIEVLVLRFNRCIILSFEVKIYVKY